jgi:hypothetical protein
LLFIHSVLLFNPQQEFPTMTPNLNHLPRPMNAADRELLEGPSIQSQMPFEFENGAIWDSFAAKCAKCFTVIEDSNLKGTLTLKTPHMAEIHARGTCHQCRLHSLFHYRLHDDWRVTGRLGNRWTESYGVELKRDWIVRQLKRIWNLLF